MTAIHSTGNHDWQRSVLYIICIREFSSGPYMLPSGLYLTVKNTFNSLISSLSNS